MKVAVILLIVFAVCFCFGAMNQGLSNGTHAPATPIMRSTDWPKFVL